jgi:DNA-directed RNA polymerase subunit RPC12/RpoP
MQAKPTSSSFTASASITQYVCSHCKTILKTNIPEIIIDRSAINEDCPTCGYPLREYATPSRLESDSSTATTVPAIPPATAFSLASDCCSGRLTFGIAELDNKFALWVGDAAFIHGPSAGPIVERLCARALLPAKSGGLGSGRVIFIDGGNSSDVYRFVEYCRLFGLDYRDALRRIVQSRAFTAYQLVDLITNHLPSVIGKIGAKAVFVADIFEMFEREPNLDEGEGMRLASKMTATLGKIPASSSSSSQQQRCLVVVSLSRKSRYDSALARLGKHLFVEPDSQGSSAILHLQDQYHEAALRVAALV